MMDMQSERLIPATREAVWRALNDTEVLKSCIPGCETLETVSPDVMRATAAIKLGPISARFTGVVTLSEIDAPNGYVISGEGQGGAAGFAKGGAVIKLQESPEGTLLIYTVQAQVGGKLAQLGARLIDATAKSMADQFFTKFTAAFPPAKQQSALQAAALPKSTEAVFNQSGRIIWVGVGLAMIVAIAVILHVMV